MVRGYTYNEVKDFLLSKDLILLSDEYINNKSKLLLKCSCGTIFSRSFQDIKNKNMYKCKFCTGNNLSYEKVKDIIEKYGCKLISTTYKNNSEKLDIECNCGNIYKVDFNTFKKGQTRCKKCYWKENKHHNSKDFETVFNYVKNNSDCKLISTEYEGVFSNLDLICHCGNKFSTNFANMQKSKKIQCIKCTNNQAANKMRKNWNDVKNELESITKGKYEIIECNYKNIHSKVTLKHIECGHIFKRSYSGIKYTENKCPMCENNVRPKTNEEAQTIIDSFSCDFEIVKYVTCSEVYVKHKNCGHIFKKRWRTIMQSQGVKCPECNPTDSVGVVEIMKYLEDNNIEYIREKTFDECRYLRKLFFDFYLPKYNACIEFDGMQHFRESKLLGGRENLELTKKRDNIKNEFCKKNNIPLKRIRYNQVKQIKSILDNYIKQVNTEVSK